MTPATDTQAARAVRRGLAVFPIPAGGRVPAPGWQRSATLDEGALPELLPDGSNIGIGCRASGIVVLDLDVHADGPARNGIETLRTQFTVRGPLGDWPDTFTVMTPSTGLHLYFRVPATCTIGSISGGRSPLGPGIDVRGPGRRSGGCLVGPGSIVGGLPYNVVRDVPVAPLPTWMTGLLSVQEGSR
ncbi:bifunctional DNA primase/polymerase [Streptomyces niveus]|uniref:bifunctional DNA primase/polymerase n=1 Tax=Streptomyces niveus TaxID=193462 RepID=UPI003404A9B7